MVITYPLQVAVGAGGWVWWRVWAWVLIAVPLLINPVIKRGCSSELLGTRGLMFMAGKGSVQNLHWTQLKIWCDCGYHQHCFITWPWNILHRVNLKLQGSLENLASWQLSVCAQIKLIKIQKSEINQNYLATSLLLLSPKTTNITHRRLEQILA